MNSSKQQQKKTKVNKEFTNYYYFNIQQHKNIVLKKHHDIEIKVYKPVSNKQNFHTI